MRKLLSTTLGMALLATSTGRALAGDPPSPSTNPSGQFPGLGEPFGTGTSGQSGQAGTVGSAGLPGSTTPDPNNPGAGLGTPADLNPGNNGTTPDFFSKPAGGAAQGLGAFDSGAAAPPGIIGDFPTITNSAVRNSTRFPTLPNPTPAPKVGGSNPGIVNGNGTTSILFKLAGLKVSDNQSPIPQDRFFYSFNYFDNLNASVDKKILSPIQNLQVYHQLFGLEKTLFDGQASIGFRVPLNTISFKSTASVPGLGGSSTSPGDLSMFFKYVLYKNENSLVSTGLQLTVPTGPGGFGGSKYYSYFRDTQFQPFVGYLYRKDRFYAQGFTSINVPSTSEDVTLLFNDIGIGYYAYRAIDPNRWLTAIVPTAEVHVTTPLNHRGYSATDLASTPDIVDMTFGTNIELRRRAILSVAYVTPVTGPKPFNAEFVMMLNIRFGGPRQNLSPLVPPPSQ
jgi:hypothetical protein